MESDLQVVRDHLTLKKKLTSESDRNVFSEKERLISSLFVRNPICFVIHSVSTAEIRSRNIFSEMWQNVSSEFAISNNTVSSLFKGKGLDCKFYLPSFVSPLGVNDKY